MAIVIPTEKLERMTAAYLVQKGKATPDQQRLAFEWFNERIKYEQEANQRPARRETETERNLIIAAYIEYCQQNNIEMGQKQACREIAADFGANEETVINSFSKWKNGKAPNPTTNEKREIQLSQFRMRLLKTVGEMIELKRK